MSDARSKPSATARQFQLAIGGVGGQGVMLCGRLLAEAGASWYPYVSYYPQFDAVMRGGQSECMVILSEEKIGSPFHFQLQAAIVMHPQFLDLYRQRMAPGGILLIDSSMVPGRVRGRNFQVFRLPATRIAVELGEGRAANMVLLGAYLAVTRALPLEQVERTLEKMLAGRGGALLSLNQKALREGARLISSLRRR